jgi:hypothetical protein
MKINIINGFIIKLCNIIYAMDVELEYIDLTEIEQKGNFIIVGHNCCGKSALNKHILYMLRVKKCKVTKSNVHINSVELLNEYVNNFGKFHVAVYYNDKGPLEIDSSDLLFVHSRFFCKEFVIKHYYKSLNDKTNYSKSYDFLKKYEAANTFFVMQNGMIKLYKPEYDNTYLEMYNAKPYCRDNITKLMLNISNRFSMYHNKTSDLYKNLQIRSRELDVLYCTILCINNSVDMWLPYDLKLEIIKLFFLIKKNEM